MATSVLLFGAQVRILNFAEAGDKSIVEASREFWHWCTSAPAGRPNYIR